MIVSLALAPFVVTKNAYANGATVQYTSFQNDTYSLYPWYGEKIVLLTRSGSLDLAAMQAIVAALDAAYGVYQTITGREPNIWGPTFLNGRSTIAEIPDGHTCGAGCGLLAFTGIELDSTRFAGLYNGYVQHGQYDQAPFYELGRNFWFYGSQLGALDPFVTGFAIANRFISMEVAGLAGGPFNQTLAFQTFKESIVFDLLNSYLADPTLNWENTLNVNQAPANPFGWSANDLAGAMFYRLFYENGIADYHVFFAVLASLPPASSPIDAVNNFIEAARLATGRDYTYLFCKSICAGLPLVVNNLVAFAPLPSSFKTIGETAGCPAGFTGKFTFSARLTEKNTSPALLNLFAKVTTLTNGNLLQNADGGPGGVGATLTVAKAGGFSDGLLTPNEFVDVPFTICLKQMKAFSFFVDVLGLTQ